MSGPIARSPVPPLPPPGRQSGYGDILGVQFAGPLPPPQILQGYEAACPGAANRIIELAEAQSAHRRMMEEKALDAQITGMGEQFHEARRGQIFAFCISALFLVCGSGVVLFGHPWPGAIFGTMGISGIVTTFIRGRSSKAETQQTTDQPQPPPKAQSSSKRKRR